MGCTHQTTYTEIKRSLYRFKLLTPFLDLRRLKMLYHTLFQTQLTYGILAWGGAREHHVKNLEILQKWMLKIMMKKRRTYSTDKLYEESKVLDIRKLYLQAILTYQYKNKINIPYLTHEYDTRNKKNNSLKERTSKLIGRRNYAYILKRLHDRTPSYLKSEKTFNSFKKTSQTWLQSLPREEIRSIMDTSKYFPANVIK
ncbi:hypothetical protein WA026_001129 [Henosepilachna vigintioctopunctata]|uniref:Uncharacterized protein n=1 Tax=Henosepilachna vigintioctopunctata TaxID=420089 RepID=A0AAW1V1F9_9CUCU